MEPQQVSHSRVSLLLMRGYSYRSERPLEKEFKTELFKFRSNVQPTCVRFLFETQNGGVVEIASFTHATDCVAI